MQQEIEIKFLNIDIDDIRKRLKRVGAKLVKPMRIMRRSIMKTPEMIARDAFARVRDEGDRITMTYKEVCTDIDDYNEVETTVADFDKAIEIITRCGIPQVSYQESKREEWHLDGVEVCIDEWPWAKPFIEIEGPSQSAVNSVANKLGFDPALGIHGTVWQVYWDEYPHIHGTKPDVSSFCFTDPLPESWKPKS